jgi:hypothetical protein
MNTEHEVTLATLQEEFPAFRITLEPTAAGHRYIARSLHLNRNPHTLVTHDPAEMRAALSTADPVLPRRRPA